MTLEFERCGGPLEDMLLSDLQRKVGYVLPHDYEVFLRTHNGGRPSRRLFHIPGCGAEALVDVLLGVGTPNSVEEWIDEMEEDLPPGFIPIGFDPGGNALLLDLSSTPAAVYYWDSARHFQQSSDDENTYRVASSFLDFLEGLVDDAGASHDSS